MTLIDGLQKCLRNSWVLNMGKTYSIFSIWGQIRQSKDLSTNEHSTSPIMVGIFQTLLMEAAEEVTVALVKKNMQFHCESHVFFQIVSTIKPALCGITPDKHWWVIFSWVQSTILSHVLHVPRGEAFYLARKIWNCHVWCCSHIPNIYKCLVTTCSLPWSL